MKLKAEIICEGCGHFEEVEYNFEEGLNTFTWTCPTCEMKRTMTRIIKKEEKEFDGNLTRIGKSSRDKPEVD